jgi:hypothetical protein
MSNFDSVFVFSEDQWNVDRFSGDLIWHLIVLIYHHTCDRILNGKLSNGTLVVEVYN